MCGTRLSGEGEVPARRDGASRTTVLLALRGARPENTPHRTVVHTRDRAAELDALSGGGLPDGPTVTVLRPDDPALVPDAGHEAVTVTAVTPTGADGAEEFAERMITAAARAVPDLRDRLLWHEVRTPEDVERETGAEGGAVRRGARRGGRPVPARVQHHAAAGAVHRRRLVAPRRRAAARGDVGGTGRRTGRGGAGLPRLAVNSGRGTGG